MRQDVSVLQHKLVGGDQHLKLELAVGTALAVELKLANDLAGLGITNVHNGVDVWDPLLQLLDPVGNC